MATHIAVLSHLAAINYRNTHNMRYSAMVNVYQQGLKTWVPNFLKRVPMREQYFNTILCLIIQIKPP